MVENATPPIHQFKFKTSMRGVDVIQTVYALLIALGLRDVFAAFYTIFQKAPPEGSDNFPIALALFANIMLLSVRFFWVPRNFRRLYFKSAFSDGFTGSKLLMWESSLNIFVILLHGLLHFLLCKQFEYFVFIATSYDLLFTASFATYVYLHASLLIVNALWIIYTTWREDDLRKEGAPEMLQAKPASRVWIRSNLAFALIAVGPLVIFASCSSPLDKCLQAAYPDSHWLSALPTSAYSIAALFDWIEPLLGAGHSRDFTVACWAMAAFAINSFLDLGFTSSYYVLLEDYEEELTYKRKD